MNVKLRFGLIAAVLIVFVVALLAGGLEISVVGATESGRGDRAEQAAATDQEIADMEKATFGAGCFWGVEAAFRRVKGVVQTAVGYAGGDVDNPTYRDVCNGNTGHAEVVQVQYDPAQVSYDDLLKVFWENHDPTQVNRQGPDIGYQYRTVVFYHNEDQKAKAEASKKQLDDSGEYNRPIATAIEPAPSFWMAEDYHQQYLEKRGLSSCGVTIKN